MYARFHTLCGVPFLILTVGALTLGLATSAPAALIEEQPGAVLDGRQNDSFPIANLFDNDTSTNWYGPSSGAQPYALIYADQVYDATSYTYVDNTDNRVASLKFRFGQSGATPVTDTSSGSTTSSSVTPMNVTVSGRGGVYVLATTSDSEDEFGGGSELSVSGDATGASRLAAPTVIDSTASFSGFEASKALDLDFGTSYAVNGSSFNLDLDFGQATTLGFVDLVGRVSAVPDSTELRFSDNDTFGDTDDVVISGLTYDTLLSSVDLEARGHDGGVTKRYLRISGSGPFATGLQDVAFYGVVPEPASLLLVCGGAIALFGRRTRRADG